jgi:hypothetical protein
MKSALAITIASGVLLLAGCRSAPIQNISDAPVTSISGKAVSAAQVRTAIMGAGAGLGWRMVDAGPGKLEGTLTLRDHTAIVEIPYSAKTYSILYKGGQNIGERDGNIHKNYNGWVQNLDRAIRGALNAL